jgi:Family of unknown function (DUF6496)
MARKYGKKASEKIERTLHEWKRGTLRSGSGGKVTSQKQAVAIGLSQARRAGGKVPPAPSHATMRWKPGLSINDLVCTYLSKMRPGTEIDARGVARAIGGVDPIAAEYALESAEQAGLAVTSDGRWFAPARGSTSHATRRKSPSQLNREIHEALSGKGRGSCGVRGCGCGCPSAHATKRRSSHATKAAPSLFAVEIDRSEFKNDELPADARWRTDLVPLAEAELARGRTYRRPKNARYAVIEWTGFRAAVGRLLDWMEGAPGITRYAEIYA